MLFAKFWRFFASISAILFSATIFADTIRIPSNIMEEIAVEETSNTLSDSTIKNDSVIKSDSTIASNAATIITDTSYRIHPGDILEISVWREEDLRREVLVRPDGGISFPLAGDFNVKGKSLLEAQKELANRLEKYIPDPVVTVSAKKMFDKKVFVIGKVNRPGEFIFTHPVDVMQALSMAGGTSIFADVDDIVILRRDTEGKQQAIPFDYADVEEGDNLDQNIILESGDVVVVP